MLTNTSRWRTFDTARGLDRLINQVLDNLKFIPVIVKSTYLQRGVIDLVSGNRRSAEAGNREVFNATLEWRLDRARASDRN
jgi:hypothetical protein